MSGKVYKFGYGNSRIYVKYEITSFGAESFVLQFAIQNIEIKICRTIILPVALYGCETWSLTLRERDVG
jgi:hypothetical protein